MAETMDPATVLEEAADLLLIHGRCKEDGVDPDGRMCVIGAIATVVEPTWRARRDLCGYWSAVGASDAASDAVLALNARVDTACDGEYAPDMRVAVWNDATDSDDEVRDTLLLTAKDLRNG